MTTTINLERDVKLNGATKTFHAHGTVVPAVRGIDVSIAAGDRRAARAQRRREVDDDRHAARADRPG